MRALLALVAVAALVVVALMQFGLVSFNQTRAAVVQAPRFEADVARVTVGTENKTVAVPTVNVTPAGQASANEAAPAQAPTDPAARTAR